MQITGREIHSKAAHAREAGEHLESLKLSDEAMLAYQADSDILGLAEILADRSIVFRHLFEDHNDKSFLIIAKHEMMASVEMAEASKDKQALALPFFNLAKVQESLGELEDAVKSYQQAVENMTSNPPQNHDRPAVLADMKIHLFVCEYKNGDKSALEKIEATITDLENADEVKYDKDVWLSGAHMKLAEILNDKDHLQKAKEIIDANPDLTIRLKQWGTLAKRLNIH